MTNATKHTPGPWAVTHQTQTNGAFDIVGGGEVIATCGYTFDKDSLMAANARLMAAAPELLEAAQQAASLPHEDACRWWRANIAELVTPEQRAANDARCDCALASVRAAIAKATGETADVR